MVVRWLLSMAVLLAAACRSDAPSRSTTEAKADARLAAEVRRSGNHLVNAGSAYLLQHAHNPVDWFPWGPEALGLATRLDRPIFLSIGYVSCHWCHVMEREVFEQDDVAAFLNEHFVSIKVDREERPDLDAVYMQAVEAMTGSGGWPMTLFLTPSLRPFFGGTYLPRDRFLEAARRASEQFRTARNAVETRGEEVHRAIALEATGGEAAWKAEDWRALAKRALSEVDPTWGGFRGRTKFPTPVRWRFLLHVYRKGGDAEIVAAIRKTLDAIDEGGIHDHVSGGFFRYATEPTWTIPHFEKMLYDNAQLASLYLEASAAIGVARYRAVGLETLEFIMREMQSEGGAFGASYDADSDGEEGAFYLFTRAELDAALGETDGPRFAEQLGVTSEGNFEHRNVVTRRVPEGAPRLAASDPEWDSARKKLEDARRRKHAPSYDAKVVTAWNGLAISALALGYRTSGDRRFLDAAVRAADAIWRQNRRDSGELARASTAGHATERAVLDDHAELALGLIDLFEATTTPMHLERAILLIDEARAAFANPAGGWFLTSAADQEPLGRRVELVDSVEPSGNAAMILAHLRLAALTGRTDLTASAESALGAYARTMQERGLEMMGWLDDALLAAGPFYELVVAGDDEVEATRKLSGVVDRLLPPWVTSVRIPASGPSDEIARWMPPAIGKRAPSGRAVGFVCKMGSCKAPRSDPARLLSDLVEGWAH